jgi:signal transduction histidine kinase
VVIAMRDPSLQFVLEQRARLFPDAAVVSAGLGVAVDERGAAVQMTGVRVVSAYSATLKAALQLHPRTRHVYVVAITHDPRQAEVVREELQQFSTQVEITYLNAETFPQLIDTVKSLPRGALLLYVWYRSHDGAVSQAVHARRVAEAATVPVYAGFESLVGTGVVGGMVNDVRGTGARVGAIARQVVNGTPPGEIAVGDAPAVPVFDWRQLRRWRLDPAELPQGADIRFRGRTAWQQSRWVILGVIVVSGQMVLIAALLRHRARRRLAEKALLSREAKLRASWDRTRQLAGSLIHAQEAARIALSRDLHDDICQDIVGIAMSINTVLQSSGEIQHPENQNALTKLHRWTLGIADHVRRISHELHPATLQLLGLVPAVKAHCLEVETRHQVRITVHITGDMKSIHPNTALCLFRVAQEGLRNAALHGRARHIEVSLSRFVDDIALAIRDDGRGFDVEATRRDGTGLGLVIMEERVRATGGEVMTWSEPGAGTTVLACVPAGAPQRSDTDIPDGVLTPLDDDEVAPVRRLAGLP